MPEPLVCEDSDLRRLLEKVHSQPGAEILYQDLVRRGGVFGFFAREVHRVAYRVASGAAAVEDAAGEAAAGEDAVDGQPARADEPAAELPQLADLLASVDALDGLDGLDGAHQRQAAASSPAPPPPHDFAELLRALTDADPDGIQARPPAIEEPSAVGAGLSAVPIAAERVRSPHPKPAPRSNVTAFGRPDARVRLEMLMQLRQVGVPVSVNPRADTHTLYEALENILEDLPAPAVPPRGAGEVLAVVGESGPALQAAQTCAAMLRIPQNSIGVAGLPERASAELDYPWISGPAEALRLRTELSRADLPSIVVIATDATEAGSDDPWAAGDAGRVGPDSGLGRGGRALEGRGQPGAVGPAGPGRRPGGALGAAERQPGLGVGPGPATRPARRPRGQHLRLDGAAVPLAARRRPAPGKRMRRFGAARRLPGPAWRLSGPAWCLSGAARHLTGAFGEGGR